MEEEAIVWLLVASLIWQASVFRDGHGHVMVYGTKRKKREKRKKKREFSLPHSLRDDVAAA